MTPPASTEPMYLISESELSELEIDSSEDTYGSTDGIEIAERIRARGPVQQAPATNIHRDTIIKLFHRIGEQPDLAAEWSKMPNAERNCMAGAFYNILAEHDAALIVEDRKRPRPPCEECIYQAQAAQAREDVLTRIITAMKTGEQCPNTYCINEQMDCIDCWVQWIESIRSEVVK